MNDSGVEVEDLVNGGQLKESDISGAGLDPATAGDGATPVTGCWQEDTSPVCNNHINVTLDGDGQVTILGDQINEGLDAPCDDATLPLGGYFSIEVLDGSGRSIGSTVDCSHIGQTLTVKSTHVVNCNSCWGTLTVEDKWVPEITCGRDTVVDCTADLDLIGGTTATDNCDAQPTIRLVNEDRQLDECNELILVRSYQATDEFGNQSSICEQTITVVPTTLTFPSDTTWNCNEFAIYPNIIGATALDDDIELTGSGVPSVAGVDNAVCRYSVDYSDEIVEACSGVSFDISFKVVRTWTVLNWCTGEVTTRTQLIEVIDNTAPVITFGSDFSNEIRVNQSAQGLHGVCSSNGIIDVPEITDNCSGIASIQLETPAGIGIPVFDNDGNITGFTVNEPFLDAGSHEVTYFVTDRCGNRTAATAQINVVDDTPPVAICSEVTQVSLSSAVDGVSTINADDLDAGSFDNCSPVYFKIRKMETGSCNDANIDKPNEQSGNEEWFDDDVKFCCTEVGTTVNVILRVYDVVPPRGAVPTDLATLLHDDEALNNRFNDCMIEVLVDDKSRPTCIAPDDIWLTCSEVPENLDFEDDDLLNDLYGEASGFDNCDSKTEAVNTIVNLDQCGVGNIIRTFRTIDNSDNTNTNTCRQTIMVQPVTDYCVTFPSDFEGECDASYAPEELTFVENGCDLISINRERTEFFAGTIGGECKKEFFTWSVINWCEYDGVSAPVKLNRDADNNGRIDSGTYCSTGDRLVFADDDRISYPSTGFYTWRQQVTIFDNTAPDVSYDGDVVFGGGDLDEDPCTGNVDITIEVDESCTEEITASWQVSTFSDRFIRQDVSGNGTTINGRFPLGTHTARFIVSDDCGNTSFEEITFEVIDTKAPTPVCFNGLSVQLMPTGMVEIWATDLDASSFDYCHDIRITANIVTDRINDGVINSADYLTTAPNDENILFTCDHVGLTAVQLWVTELSNDDVNQSDYCVTFVEVQDNQNACDASRMVSIGGNIQNEEGESVEHVTVHLSGDATQSQITKKDGKFRIESLLEGNDYTISPTRNDDIRNGVSTFDLALISKHVLNVQRLDSPYKMIAADANRSGSITTLDLVAIRKVILFVSNEFPNNSSWRFIDKDYQFTNPNNPFEQFFPEVKNINNILRDETANFIGIKIGDVNSNAQANSLSSVEERSFNGNFLFEVEDRQFEEGETIEVMFSSEELKNMIGYQFTLNFNAKVLELLEIQDQSATQQNFGQTMVEDGILTCSWNDETVKDGNAFKLIFETKAAGKISELITINSNYTTAEAYTKSGEFKNVGIDFGEKAHINGFVLYQNQPNPFLDETTIGFELPQQSEATLTISDILGRNIKTIKGNYVAGYNEILVDMKNAGIGVYILRLETSTHSASIKMKKSR